MRASRTVAALLFAASTAWAVEPTVDQIQVRQRWPWSGLVDVDYRLNADSACDVEFAATWFGGGDLLTNGVCDRAQLAVAPGPNHFVWDPSKSGLSGKKSFENLRIAASAGTVLSRTYLVVDLVDGSYTYLPEPPPEPGFLTDDYKTRYMVFRRIPAGTYELGHTAQELTLANSAGGYTAAQKAVAARRSVRVSNDFYMTIFPVTRGQWSYGTTGSAYSSASLAKAFYSDTYDLWRGSYAQGVNWPSTGHAVAPDSYVGLMRSRISFATGMILDLPTESAWEVATRGGTVTVYPTGGTAENTKAELSEFLNRCGYIGGNPYDVGYGDSNAWGLYDLLGQTWEWTLEGYNSPTGGNHLEYVDFRDPLQTTDPVGKVCLAENLCRMTVNGGYCTGGFSMSTIPAYRAARTPDNTKCGVRLCVYLDPLVK